MMPVREGVEKAVGTVAGAVLPTLQEEEGRLSM